jgi:hypothetical protein
MHNDGRVILLLASRGQGFLGICPHYSSEGGQHIWVVSFEFGYRFGDRRVKGGGDTVDNHRIDGFTNAELVGECCEPTWSVSQQIHVYSRVGCDDEIF